MDKMLIIHEKRKFNFQLNNFFAFKSSLMPNMSLTTKHGLSTINSNPELTCFGCSRIFSHFPCQNSLSKITFLLLIYYSVISRYVNASDVYAVPFTVVFWQERELTSQSKYKILAREVTITRNALVLRMIDGSLWNFDFVVLPY